MAEITAIGKVALVNYTTAEWETETRIPYRGCACVEFTPDGKTKLKIGNGTNLFSELSYVADELTAALIIAALGYKPLDSAKLGVAEGVASLDESGKVPASQLPSFVDDVSDVGFIINSGEIEKAVDEEGNEISPETGKIYLNVLENTVDGTAENGDGKAYRWSGSTYAAIPASDIVTPSELNGYIKINGTDVKVFDPADIEAALSNKIDKSDTLILNCTL